MKPINLPQYLLLAILFMGLVEQGEAENVEPLTAWPAGVVRAAAEVGIPLESISIEVREPRGATLLALNPNVTRKTGSVMKLLTTFVALQQMGPAFRFHTDLFANPEPGHPHGWRVALRGGGDSGLQYADLLALLRQSRDQGVTKIVGDIVIDRRRFNLEDQLTSGIDLEKSSLSGIKPDALSVGYSAIEMRLPAHHRGRIEIDPPFRLFNSTHSSDLIGTECPKDWEQELVLIAQAPGVQQSEALRLNGIWPDHCPEGVIRRAPLTSEEQLKWSIWSAVRNLGQSVRPDVVEGVAPSYAKVSIRYHSRPLYSLVRDINKFSNNVAARTLLLNLAAETGQIPASAKEGAKCIQNWLKARNFQFPELVIENGSGLSHQEVLSAHHLAELLNAIKEEEAFSYFLDSLPIPGENGTLQKRFAGRSDRLQWHLKTGRLDGVRALAGYRITQNGSIYTVVCMIEHERADQAIAVQEALLDWIALK